MLPGKNFSFTSKIYNAAANNRRFILCAISFLSSKSVPDKNYG